MLKGLDTPRGRLRALDTRMGSSAPSQAAQLPAPDRSGQERVAAPAEGARSGRWRASGRIVEVRRVAPSRRQSPGTVARSDDDLARRFVLGEHGALACVEALITRTVRFRGYYIPSEDRRDLVQETILETCQALARPGFSLAHGLAAFVRSIAYRRCVDWMRRYRAYEALDPTTEDPSGRPDQRLLGAEQQELAREILDELRPACRELFRLHAVESLSYHAIAGRQGRTEGALRTQMCDCLREARAIFLRKQRRRDRDSDTDGVPS